MTKRIGQFAKQLFAFCKVVYGLFYCHLSRTPLPAISCDSSSHRHEACLTAHSLSSSSNARRRPMWRAIAMLPFRTIGYRGLFLCEVMAMLPPTPALGEQVLTGLWTYRYAYNPGYYGSPRRPWDPGAKPGQASVSGNGPYWYLPKRFQPAPQVNPPEKDTGCQSYRAITRTIP